MHPLPIHYGKTSNHKIVIFILRKKQYDERMLALEVRHWEDIR